MGEYGGKGKFTLPKNHKAGLAVPRGGSSCANCKFYTGKGTCTEPNFVEWNGSNEIPADSPDEYCSDFWTGK